MGEPALVLIESREGLLFRGPELMGPTEVWHYGHKKWVPFNPRREPVFAGWGTVVDDARGELLKHENPAAAHYLYYDVAPWVQA